MKNSTENIDLDEKSKFNALASEWWDSQGEIQTLHDINPTRLIYIVDHINLADKQILDVGCGGGLLTEALAVRGGLVTGIDISEHLLHVADEHAKKANLDITYTCTTVENFSSNHSNAFDVITCIAVMEHVYDIFSLAKEMFRVLKPGGYVVAEVPNIAYLKHRISLLLGLLPVTSSPYNWKEVGWDGGHIHYFTMRKFSLLFSSQGFRIEEKCGSGFLAKLRNWWPTLLCGDLVIKAVKQ